MNDAMLPEVLPVHPPEAVRAATARKSGTGFVGTVAGWCWRMLVLSLFCLSYVSSVLIVGWSYRWMQGLVLRGLWKRSRLRQEETFAEFCDRLGPDAPTVRPRLFVQERIARNLRNPLPNGQAPGTLRLWLRALRVPWHSLWLNFKVGFLGLFCTYLLTGWGCLAMLVSWEFGWLNSFNKGYEQAIIGPLTGFLGIFLFIAAMFYVPMAQVHQAVTGDYRAFFDFRFVWRLIRSRLTAYVLLAATVTLLSLPLEALKTAPAFFDRNEAYQADFDGLAEAMFLLPDPEAHARAEVHRQAIHQALLGYFLACSVFLMVALMLTRGLAATIYRSALLRALETGQVRPADLHPVLANWLDRLDLQPACRVVPGGIGQAVRGGSVWIYRRFLFAGLFAIWFVFVARVYVGEFFHYHPVVGFANHALVQFPCFNFIPDRLAEPVPEQPPPLP